MLKMWVLQKNLVDWLKMMVGGKRWEEVVDTNLENRPSTSALKRALLTALRCVDPNPEQRPTMSQVVRMLESDEYPVPREVGPLPLFPSFSFKTFSSSHVFGSSCISGSSKAAKGVTRETNRQVIYYYYYYKN